MPTAGWATHELRGCGHALQELQEGMSAEVMRDRGQTLKRNRNV